MNRPAAGLPALQLDDRGLPRGSAFNPASEVTPRQARERIAAGALLLDVRRPDEFAVAKIPGASLVPMHEVEARIDEIEELAGGRSGEIIVQCHHGRRSLTVTHQLRALGFTNVKSMAGGIDVWSADIDPSVPRY